MELKYLASASVIITHNNVNILCDPWFFDGIWLGKWFHYPPININIEKIIRKRFISNHYAVK